MVDDDERQCAISTFHHSIDRPGFHQKIAYDIRIPLPDNSTLDHLGHLLVQQNVPIFAHKEIEVALKKFVWNETRKLTAEFANKLIQEKLAECNFDAAKLSYEICSNNAIFQSEPFDAIGKENGVDGGLPIFEEQFQQVMRQCSSAHLSHLIRVEAAMTEEMRMLVQARDFEVGRLEKAYEASLAASNSHKLDNPQQLSLLTTEIRQVGIDYSRQIEALLERQKRDYRALVRRMFMNEEIDTIGSKEKCTLPHSSTSFESFKERNANNSNGGNQSSKGKFKKSISCDDKISHIDRQPSNYSESFSIYIGSQLKTMHNARILSCHRLSDLCIISHSSSDDQHADLFGSKRLHLLMNLYGRELSAVVLIVGRDPLWHIKKRTHFARLCEQSAELHFDSMETQLRKIEEQVRTANRNRRLKREMVDLSQLSYSPPMDFYECAENMLQPGDVYLTRHSNLSAVHVVFHLVGDSALSEEDISSRHPCICGLRNIVRLSAASAIRNISLPLLMAQEVSEEVMTANWCQSRAELVFKCLKGFLMEINPNGSNTSLAGTPAPGPAQCLHFNINFALPSAIPPPIFRQLVDLFASIYYLVPSFNA